MKIIVDMNDELKKHNTSNPELTSMFLYLEHEGVCYPTDDWIDNPAIVLGWWVHSIIDLIRGGVGQGFCFMEGPYLIHSSLEDNNLLLKTDDNCISWRINVHDFVRELIKAMNQASRYFYEMGFISISEGFNREVADLKRLIFPKK